MSRVTIRELQEGELALSADVNSTLSSWNTALGLVALGADNFRQEGLDRRSILKHSVYSQRQGTSNTACYNEWATASGAIAAYQKVTCGSDVQLGPITVSDDDAMYVWCFARITADPNSTVTLSLERSTDPGFAGAFEHTNTRRSWRQNGTFRAGAVGLKQDIVIVHRHLGGVGTWYYRLMAVDTGAAALVVRNAVMLAEVIAV